MKRHAPFLLRPEAAEAPRPLRVVGVPAFQNRTTNPYNALLYGALEERGVDAREVTVRNLFGTPPDILHVHWPEYLFSGRTTLRAFMNATAFMVVLRYLAARGTRVVWTVHNLASHDGHHPRLEQRMWRWFIRRVDACISMTPAGHSAAIARFPELAQRPAFVIPHGHYRGVYPAEVDRCAARATLGVHDDTHPLAVFFGSVRPYKGVPGLMRAFGRIADPTWRLIIAGKIQDDDLRTEITTIADSDNRVALVDEFLPDQDVQYYLRAADLVVLPYRDILNSGSAILALTFGARVLVPAIGAANDLAALMGPTWVRTYTGELTTHVLTSAMTWATGPRPVEGPPLDHLAWDRIAALTNEAYLDVLQAPAFKQRARSLARSRTIAS